MGGERACSAGHGELVVTVARTLADPCKRVGLLSAAAAHLPPELLRAELEANIAGLIESAGEIHDDAFGRAVRHLGPAATRTMWGHAFSLGRHTRKLAFSWRSTTPLEVTASLRGGDAVELVTWAARIARTPSRPAS